MDQNSMQMALNVLIRVKERLLDSLVDELIRHQDDDPSSFSLQEIEDRFAIRIANLNTLIVTLQDQLGHLNQGPMRITTNIEETTRNKLELKLNDLLEFLSPEELVHISITPTTDGKFLIVLAHQEDSN